MLHSRSVRAVLVLAVTCACGGAIVPGPADASPDLPDVATADDHATEPASTTLSCGQATCDLNTQDCCTSMNGSSCAPHGTCGSQTALQCTSSANCTNGDVCCGDMGSASCVPSCTKTPLCVATSDCPQGQSCVKTMMGYSVCTN